MTAVAVDDSMLAELFAVSKTPLCILGAQGRVIRTNESFAELTGIHDGSEPGLLRERMTPCGVGALVRAYSGVPTHIGPQSTHPSDSTKVWTADATTHLTVAGTVVLLSADAFDPARVETEIELHRGDEDGHHRLLEQKAIVEVGRHASEQRRASVFDGFHDPIAVLEAVRDADGRVVDWTCREANRALLSLVGFRHGPLVGKSLKALFPEVAARTMAFLECGDEHRAHEATFAERDYSIRLSRVKTAEVVVTGRDVTQLTRVEHALRPGTESFEPTTNTVPGALYDYAIDAAGVGSFVSMSPEATDIFETPVAKLLADSNGILGLVFAEDIPAHHRDQGHSRDPSRREVEICIVTPSGAKKRVRFTWSESSSTADGTVRGSGSILDVTDMPIGNAPRRGSRIELGALGAEPRLAPPGKTHDEALPNPYEHARKTHSIDEDHHPERVDCRTGSELPPALVLPNPRRGRVLILDDEVLIGQGLKRALKSEHDVLTLTDARDALRRIRDGERFDVILCDLMMPDLTGMDLHRALLVVDADQASRMVFLSGGAFTPCAKAFLADGTITHLEKPCDLTSLRALIRHRVGRPL